jgi:chaperone modulatory protein CbpM
MISTHPLMAPWARTGKRLTLEEVAARCGLHPALVEHFVTLGIIDPIEGTPRHFPQDVMLRIQRLMRLRRDFGLNYQAVALVLDLLDRIEALEAHLQQIEAQSQGTSAYHGRTR